MNLQVRVISLIATLLIFTLFTACTPDETPENGDTVSEEPVRTLEQAELDALDSAKAEIRVEEIALEYARMAGYDMGKIYVNSTTEVYKSPELWVWKVDIEGENGPAAMAMVRADLDRIELFDAIAESSPLKAESGTSEPVEIADALGFDELGYKPALWVSGDGKWVYRKQVKIGEWDVSVGYYTIRTNTENGNFIGTTWIEYEPLESFEMNFEEEEAYYMAAAFLNRDNPELKNTDIIQLMDGSSVKEDMNVYWELKFDEGFVYVRCRDGQILINQAGIGEPLGV
ncbi:MAG TPA: hypothetical protein ENN67_05125 [Firmicutes bacterium]|nr:hypothetical protein [Bacillota bacterium]